LRHNTLLILLEVYPPAHTFGQAISRLVDWEVSV